MSLKHALLDLLDAEPMSGYELDQILDETFGYPWTAPHSQIYPALRQMEQDDWIAAQVKHTGERERREYRILDPGRRELERWAGEPVPYVGIRDIAHLKASMMDMLSLDQCEAIFIAHRDHYQQRLRIWNRRIEAVESGSSELLRARLANRPADEHAKLIAFKLCGYEGSAMRARTEMEWAEHGLATVASLRQAEARGAAKARKAPPVGSGRKR